MSKTREDQEYDDEMRARQSEAREHHARGTGKAQATTPSEWCNECGLSLSAHPCRLHASAPEMYAALRQSVGAFDRADKNLRCYADDWAGLRAAAEAARAVLARIEGSK